MRFRQKGPPQTEASSQTAPQYSKTDKYFETGALRSPNYVKGKQGVKIDLETGTLLQPSGKMFVPIDET